MMTTAATTASPTVTMVTVMVASMERVARRWCSLSLSLSLLFFLSPSRFLSLSLSLSLLLPPPKSFFSVFCFCFPSLAVHAAQRGKPAQRSLCDNLRVPLVVVDDRLFCLFKVKKKTPIPALHT